MKNFSTNTINPQLQSIVDCLEDAILVESKERVVESINESFHSLFKLKSTIESFIGINSEEIIVNSSLQFKNPSKFIYRTEELITDNHYKTNEEVLLLDGRILNRTFKPIFIDGQVVRFIWIYKVKEQPIVKPTITSTGGDFFGRILNNISIPIAVFNVQQEFVFVNKKAIIDENKRKIAIGRTEIEYNSYFNKPNEIALLNADYLRNTIATKQTTFYEEKQYSQQGDILYYRVVLIPLLAEREETVEYVIKYSIDITNTKQQEIECTKTINQYINILNTINESVFITNESLELSFSNTSFMNKLSSEAQLFKSTLFNHVDVTQHDFYRSVFSVLNGNEEKISGKIKLDNNKSNKTFLYKLSKLTPLNNKNNKAGIVAILNDITNEVVMEENLLEVVKREKELNELKSAFVNMVSHEMRTPLAVIYSCVEIMQLMIESNKPKEEILNYTSHVLTEVDRMTTFMNDILMVSKIEAGKIEFYPELISLTSFINDLNLKSYSPWKDNRFLDVSVKGLEREVAIDTKMIRHILQNLLDNAFKYSAGKANPKLRISYSNTYVTLSIIDKGIGIHNQDIPKLFSSFSRGRNVGRISGTGIGLVVVKYFVNQHKGSISVRSEINNGSIFSLKIPYLR